LRISAATGYNFTLMFKRYCLFFTLALGLQAADASSSWYGTWKMDASKSDTTRLKSLTLTIHREGETDVIESSGVDVQGKPSNNRRTQPHGGGKVIDTPPEPEHYDDAIVTLPDDHHSVYTFKKSGKTVAEGHVTLSADGKILESTIKVLPRTPGEKPFVETLYLVKQ
jgi:hypothetical protein